MKQVWHNAHRNYQAKSEASTKKIKHYENWEAADHLARPTHRGSAASEALSVH